MAPIPLLRVIIFWLITLFSLVVLGLCIYVEYELPVVVDSTTAFVPLGLGAAGLSVISLPLFLLLGRRRTRVFTSKILFEIIWFFLLWIIWGATAGATVSSAEFYSDISGPVVVLIETFAFLNSICAWIYYATILVYAMISAVRGRSIWTVSVKEAANFVPVVVPMVPYAAPVQYGGYYPPNVPFNQPYNTSFQQGSLVQPHNPYSQQVPGQVPFTQPYNTYPPPQGAPNPQYNTSPPQAPPVVGQQYSYPATPGAPSPQQHAGYGGYNTSMGGNDTTVPPQPNYTMHPAHAPLPLPSGRRT